MASSAVLMLLFGTFTAYVASWFVVENKVAQEETVPNPEEEH